MAYAIKVVNLSSATFTKDIRWDSVVLSTEGGSVLYKSVEMVCTMLGWNLIQLKDKHVW